MVTGIGDFNGDKTHFAARCERSPRDANGPIADMMDRYLPKEMKLNDITRPNFSSYVSRVPHFYAVSRDAITALRLHVRVVGKPPFRTPPFSRGQCSGLTPGQPLNSSSWLAAQVIAPKATSSATSNPPSAQQHGGTRQDRDEP